MTSGTGSSANGSCPPATMQGGGGGDDPAVYATPSSPGDYEPGDRQPSTRRLAEANGISATTVQDALRVLTDEGLSVSHQGRGAFVQQPPEEAAGEGTSSTPETLDEALKMLAEVNARLDQLEARVPQPKHDPGPDPISDQTHRMDL